MENLIIAFSVCEIFKVRGAGCELCGIKCDIYQHITGVQKNKSTRKQKYISKLSAKIRGICGKLSEFKCKRQSLHYEIQKTKITKKQKHSFNL